MGWIGVVLNNQEMFVSWFSVEKEVNRNGFCLFHRRFDLFNLSDTFYRSGHSSLRPLFLQKMSDTLLGHTAPVSAMPGVARLHRRRFMYQLRLAQSCWKSQTNRRDRQRAHYNKGWGKVYQGNYSLIVSVHHAFYLWYVDCVIFSVSSLIWSWLSSTIK